MGERKRGCGALLLRLGLVLAVLGLLAAGGAYAWLVVLHPGEHLRRDHILGLISQESPVYYRDGTTKVGVFFAEQHRQYVPFDELPGDFVNALVAAEDQRFWDHRGVDLRGITRAMLGNLKAGRVTAGGSTLTQQTAKNLFKRQGRTLREKLREALNALRLEAHYSKEDILEFYSNQFYVNGNGRGVAIAARFFFDKELADLTLVESAFLAGVVKGPERYNPWVADEARRARALERSEERVEYVVGRMLREGTIDQAAHDAAVAADVPFERGHFRFERSVVLDEVERELRRPHFQRLLEGSGIDDLGTAGLRVITTLDPEIQRGALYGLRHHLSEVGPLLEAPPLTAWFGDGDALRPVDADALLERSFHRVNLTAVDVDGRRVEADLGGVQGVFDEAALLRLAETRKRAEQGNTWVRAGKKDVAALLTELEGFVGRSTTASIRSVTAEGPLLDFELRPELQGAVYVVEGGRVRAMVGGAGNADFNRAVAARRQLGSTWKLLVFEAALQLRWSALDALDNRRAVFPYQGALYYPRPDHKGAPETVSMAWAAAKSENLASIWLLYHLTDKLNDAQLRQVATQVGLAPEPGEEHRDWVARVQAAGLVTTRSKRVAGLYEEVVRDLAVDLAFDGGDEEAERLRSLHYGVGLADALEELDGAGLDATEKGARQRAASRTFLRQEALADRWDRERERLVEASREGPLSDEVLALLAVGEDGALSFGPYGPAELEPVAASSFEQRVSAQLAGLLASAAVDAPDAAEASGPRDGGGANGSAARERPAPTGGPDDIDRMFDAAPPAPGGERASLSPAPRISPELRAEATERVLADVRMEGRLRPGLIRRVRAALDEAERAPVHELGLYAFEELARVPEFRVLVGLQYVAALARRSGVRSDIVPVLSMALGASEITLAEAASMYEVMATGATWGFYPDPLASSADLPAVGASDDLPQRCLIQELRLADGRVLYRAARHDRPVQTSRVTGQLGTLLRAVVAHGTGRRAEGAVAPTSRDPARAAELASLAVRVPLFGKTGTTNSYRNSAFVGVVPAARGDRLAWGAGTVVSTYVGYDDNREMNRKGVRLAGASGSLPVWIEAVAAAVRASDLGDKADLADVAFAGGGMLPVTWPPGFATVRVSAETGLPVQPGQTLGADAATVELAVPSGDPPFEPFLAEVREDS